MDVSKDIVKNEFSGIGFDEVLEYLIEEVKARNYLITRINNIDNIHDRIIGDTGSKVKFKFYKIVEFCNLESCSQLISSNFLAGVFMPVKFIVYQPNNEEKVFVSFLKPTSFAKIFNSVRLNGIAKIIEKDMYEILEEVFF
tara:strand:+ start:108 stop:530 length:423 start_codon:yes stop_codon:yes gene_type:complete